MSNSNKKKLSDKELSSVCNLADELADKRGLAPAMNFLNETIQKIEDFWQIAFLLTVAGNIYGRYGEYSQAIKTFFKALKINPSSAFALKNLAVALGEIAEEEEALKFIDKALEIDPDNAETLQTKGKLLYDLVMYPEALECYNQVVKLKPKDAFSWYDKGCVLKEMGKKEEADKCFEKAKKLNPNIDKDVKDTYTQKRWEIITTGTSTISSRFYKKK
jgi:tetratricopeptide (TPR) repeat protein